MGNGTIRRQHRSTLRGRENSSEAVGTASNQDSTFSWLPRNTEHRQARSSESSPGREFTDGNWHSKQSTKSGRQRMLRLGEGSPETADQGQPATKLGTGGWNTGRERWRDGVWETVVLEGSRRAECKLKPESHSEDSFPNFHFSSNFPITSP